MALTYFCYGFVSYRKKKKTELKGIVLPNLKCHCHPFSNYHCVDGNACFQPQYPRQERVRVSSHECGKFVYTLQELAILQKANMNAALF